MTFEAVKREIYNRDECGGSNRQRQKKKRSQILPEFYQRGETAKKLISLKIKGVLEKETRSRVKWNPVVLWLAHEDIKRRSLFQIQPTDTGCDDVIEMELRCLKL